MRFIIFFCLKKLSEILCSDLFVLLFVCFSVVLVESPVHSGLPRWHDLMKPYKIIFIKPCNNMFVIPYTTQNLIPCKTEHWSNRVTHNVSQYLVEVMSNESFMSMQPIVALSGMDSRSIVRTTVAAVTLCNSATLHCKTRQWHNLHSNNTNNTVISQITWLHDGSLIR